MNTFTLTIITVAFCTLTVSLYLGFLTHYRTKSNYIIKYLQKLILNIDKDEFNFSENGLSKSYKQTFNSAYKTSEYSSSIYNMESLAKEKGLNISMINIVPNLLTSLGILGTFVGLTCAIYSFDSSTSSSIKESIQILLSGMGTAFFTSVFGIGTSFLFLISDRSKKHRIISNLNELCDKLDNRFYETTSQNLNRLLSYTNEDGDKFAVVDVLNDLKEDVKKTKIAVESLSTDIVDALGDKLGKDLENTFVKNLIPILKDIIKRLENPAEIVIDSLVKELKLIIDNFGKTLTKDVEDKMLDLLSKMNDSINIIEDIPGTLENLNTELQNTTTNLNGKITECILSFNSTIKEFDKTTNKLSVATGNLEETIIPLDDLHNKLSSISISISSASSSIEQTSNTLKDVHTKCKENIDGHLKNITKIQSDIGEIHKEIQTGLKGYQKTTKETLQNMLDSFTSAVTDSISKINNTVVRLKDNLDEMDSFINSVKELADYKKLLKELIDTINNMPIDKTFKNKNLNQTEN